MNINYSCRISMDVEKEMQFITFTILLEDIEDDSSIYSILELKLESYMQDNYCGCSFSESQNHCDCDLGDFSIFDIVSREIEKPINT